MIALRPPTAGDHLTRFLASRWRELVATSSDARHEYRGIVLRLVHAFEADLAAGQDVETILALLDVLARELEALELMERGEPLRGHDAVVALASDVGIDYRRGVPS